MFKSRQMKETILAYKRVFDSKDGKKVLVDLMKSCHMMDTTFDKDPYETHFNEGARSVLIRILKTTKTNMEQLDKFIENMEQEEHYE